VRAGNATASDEQILESPRAETIQRNTGRTVFNREPEAWALGILSQFQRPACKSDRFFPSAALKDVLLRQTAYSKNPTALANAYLCGSAGDA
jgi:hypothetical protein